MHFQFVGWINKCGQVYWAAFPSGQLNTIWVVPRNTSIVQESRIGVDARVRTDN